MRDLFIKLFMDINAFLIRFTNGRIGGKLGKQTILLLETTGRKSGQPRVIPIAYFFHEGKYLIVESNWGKDKHAEWYLNLKKTPRDADRERTKDSASPLAQERNLPVCGMLRASSALFDYENDSENSDCGVSADPSIAVSKNKTVLLTR
jgi:deazaflavin-dependent oxidoreductase (nitroreductase family)